MVVAKNTPPSTPNPFTILVAEDHHVQRQYLDHQLSTNLPSSTKIQLVGNGYDAIREIFSDQIKNVLILDYNLCNSNQATNSPPELTELIKYFKVRQYNFDQLVRNIQLVTKGGNKSLQANLICSLAQAGLLDLSNGLNIATLTRALLKEKINILVTSADAKNEAPTKKQGFDKFFIKTIGNFQRLLDEIFEIIRTTHP